MGIRMARLVEARSYISKNCSGERGGRMGSEMEMDGSRIFMAILEWEKPTGRGIVRGNGLCYQG
jgi:hypothetical protein